MYLRTEIAVEYQESMAMYSLGESSLSHRAITGPVAERLLPVEEVQGTGNAYLNRNFDCTNCRYTNTCGGECRRKS